MIKIKLLGVYNIKYAILGIQNPMNSWHLIDSNEPEQAGNCKLEEKDLNPAQHLTLAGPEKDKILRFVTVCLDLTAPLYWWKEFDTCKFAEIKSCSTTHKLANRNPAPHGFSFRNLEYNWDVDILRLNDPIKAHKSCVRNSEESNGNRKVILRELVQNLPNSYMQKKIVITNYAELRSIYFQCRSHNLDEWRKFCYWVKETLPYAEDLICLEKNKFEN